MKNTLKLVPGFRTGTKWKMIIAGIYYLLCLTTLTNGVGEFLFAESIPFLIFYGISAFKTKGRESIAIAVVAFIIMCFGIGLTPTTQKNTSSKIAISSNKSSINVVKKSNASSKDKNKSSTTPTAGTKSENKAQSNSSVSGQLKIHYINVGQGDSELIQNNGQNMLIDTGTNESTNSLISYLKSQNISKIDYLVLTHPHEDHIGGAADVIKDFDIGTIYMNNKTTNTKTYKDMIVAIKQKNLKVTVPILGQAFKNGDANCIVYGPVNPIGDDLNTYSIVIKVTFGNNKFLFTGDAQASNEDGMISNGYDLSDDVLKVGHHGSHTSTAQAFLDKVNPKYAVISCGKGNDYGHPHEETMQRLQIKGIKVYRTDENGTVVCTSDGSNISFSCNPGDYASGGSGSRTSTNNSSSNSTPAPSKAQQPQVSSATPAQPNDSAGTQYVDSNGNGLIKGNINSKGQKIYHLPGDRWYDRTKAESLFKTVKEAEAAGFRAPLN